MKVSDLSFADMAALEIIARTSAAGIVTHASRVAQTAYAFADALDAERLKRDGVREHEITALTKRCNQAITSLSVLRGLHEKPEHVLATGLSNLWEMLGVSDYHAARERLRMLLDIEQDARR